jgi:hypothetical protein
MLFSFFSAPCGVFTSIISLLFGNPDNFFYQQMKGANVFPCSSSSKISFGGIKLLLQTLLFILIILSLCYICFPHRAEYFHLLNRCSFEILTKFLFFSEKFSDTPNKFPYISFSFYRLEQPLLLYM